MSQGDWEREEKVLEMWRREVVIMVVSMAEMKRQSQRLGGVSLFDWEVLRCFEEGNMVVYCLLFCCSFVAVGTQYSCRANLCGTLDCDLTLE